MTTQLVRLALVGLLFLMCDLTAGVMFGVSALFKLLDKVANLIGCLEPVTTRCWEYLDELDGPFLSVLVRFLTTVWNSTFRGVIFCIDSLIRVADWLGV